LGVIMIHNDERLLLQLIERYYGLVPSLTAKVFIHHGAMLMRRAQAHSTLTRADFHRGLDVLHRCNLFTVTEIGRQKLLDINKATSLTMLYSPYCLEIVFARFWVEPVSLPSTLFLSGNLSITALLERPLYHIIHSNSLSVIEPQTKYFINSLCAQVIEP